MQAGVSQGWVTRQKAGGMVRAWVGLSRVTRYQATVPRSQGSLACPSISAGGILRLGCISGTREPAAGWDSPAGRLTVTCSLFKGELYFMSTGVPSATAARGVIYKVIDPSR